MLADSAECNYGMSRHRLLADTLNRFIAPPARWHESQKTILKGIILIHMLFVVLVVVQGIGTESCL
jgi:hypothetical protein